MNIYTPLSKAKQKASAKPKPAKKPRAKKKEQLYGGLADIQRAYLQSTILLATLQSEGHTDLISLAVAMPPDAPQMAWDILEHYRKYNKTPQFDRTPYKPHGVITAGDEANRFTEGRPHHYDEPEQEEEQEAERA